MWNMKCASKHDILKLKVHVKSNGFLKDMTFRTHIILPLLIIINRFLPGGFIHTFFSFIFLLFLKYLNNNVVLIIYPLTLTQILKPSLQWKILSPGDENIKIH